MKTELTDGSILLRPFSADDIDSVFEAVRESMKEIGAWMSWCHQDYSRDEAAAFILSRPEAEKTAEEHSFAIVDAKTGAFIGSAGLNQLNRAYQKGNLGYWVRTSCTKRGVASAAARMVAQFAFRETGLQRVEIVAAVGNLASQRVAEKTGAKREGVLRKRLLIHGQPHDAVLYSLVAEDLEDER